MTTPAATPDAGPTPTVTPTAPVAPAPTPSIGRIVHYVLAKPPPDPKKSTAEIAGEHRAAVITGVSGSANKVSLSVFRGACDDFAIGEGRVASTDPDKSAVAFVPEVEHDPDGRKPHSWHWPEKV